MLKQVKLLIDSIENHLSDFLLALAPDLRCVYSIQANSNVLSDDWVQVWSVKTTGIAIIAVAEGYILNCAVIFGLDRLRYEKNKQAAKKNA